MLNRSEIINLQRENLRKFMKLNNLNANSWTKKAGISEGTIRNYLSGRSASISTLSLELLAQAIGVNSCRLLWNNYSDSLDNNIEISIQNKSKQKE